MTDPRFIQNIAFVDFPFFSTNEFLKIHTEGIMDFGSKR